MALEVRIAREGEVRLVQASGYTGVMTTAATPSSALLAYAGELRATFQPPTFAWIRDRGVLSHVKRTNDGGPYRWEIQALLVDTATFSAVATASGVSVPKYHLEYKTWVPEFPSGTGANSWSASAQMYQQLFHAVLVDHSFEEGEEGDTIRLAFEGWSARHYTASGYIT